MNKNLGSNKLQKSINAWSSSQVSNKRRGRLIEIFFMTPFSSFSRLFVHSQLVYTVKFRGGLNIWLVFSRVKNNILPLENKIYIFAPPCNTLYVFNIC